MCYIFTNVDIHTLSSGRPPSMNCVLSKQCTHKARCIELNYNYWRCDKNIRKSLRLSRLLEACCSIDGTIVFETRRELADLEHACCSSPPLSKSCYQISILLRDFRFYYIFVPTFSRPSPQRCVYFQTWKKHRSGGIVLRLSFHSYLLLIDFIARGE